MCMEDLAMSRASKSQEFTRLVTTAARVPLIGEDQSRIALVISPPESGFITISLGENNAITDGIRLASGGSPLIWYTGNVGNLVSRALFAQHSAADQQIHVMFTILEVDSGYLASLLHTTREGYLRGSD